MTKDITPKIQAERTAELAAEMAEIDSADTFALYWADTVGGSVLRDYRAGRVETIRAQRRRAKSNAEALKRAKKVAREPRADATDGEGGEGEGSTEPTPEGLQYVLPGCEKDRSRSSTAQLDLF
uniref:hypothetical protein n=1 Tax=Stappia sp. TaxID=1870903 RepID=UPI003BA941EF